MLSRQSRRRLARMARCAGLVAVLAVLVAGPARADNASPLTALVDAAAQRLQVAEQVAAYKWTTHGAIEDPVRVQQQLATLGDQAAAGHIDRNYVTGAFGDQIRATEAIEYSRFADWKLNPGDAPAGAPDLTASRSAIDAFNQTMLAQMVANWALLHSPACPTQLEAANGAVIPARQLDGLYQRALALATRSYCQQ